MAFDDLNQRPEPEVAQKTGSTRDMTALDDLTHNFTGDPAMRTYFLERYGQCYENGQRFTR